MEMDEDEPASSKRAQISSNGSDNPKLTVSPLTASIPVSSMLFVENLPANVTEDVLAVLFQQYATASSSSFSRMQIAAEHTSPHLPLNHRYSGFQGTKLSAPNPTTKSKTANVKYDSADQATVALEALNGFQIDHGWKMRVAYAAV